MSRALWFVSTAALCAALSACGSPTGPAASQPAPASAPAATPAPFWRLLADAPDVPGGNVHVYYACWYGEQLITEGDGTVWKGAVTVVQPHQGQPCFQ